MRKVLAAAGGGLVATLVTIGPAWGHHAFSAEFDANRPVKLRGVVTKMEWVNPHSWMHLSVKTTDGRAEAWMVELGPPGALVRRGWSKASVPAGMELLVEGFQAKDGTLKANGRDVVLPDGRRLFVGSSGTGAPDERPEK
jgi:hypothetical protein